MNIQIILILSLITSSIIAFWGWKNIDRSDWYVLPAILFGTLATVASLVFCLAVQINPVFSTPISLYWTRTPTQLVVECEVNREHVSKNIKDIFFYNNVDNPAYEIKAISYKNSFGFDNGVDLTLVKK